MGHLHTGAGCERCGNLQFEKVYLPWKLVLLAPLTMCLSLVWGAVRPIFKGRYYRCIRCGKYV